MRRVLTIAFLLATIALSGAAQPEATWLERQHDFGVFLEQNGKVTCQMRVVNTGNEPLMVVKAQAGCGCTAINYPQSEILPGDTASIDITYNPSGRPGQFTKQAIIFTNTNIKRTILEITGNVIPTAKTLDKQYPVSAGSLRISQPSIPFGEMKKGENKTLFLSAYNSSTDTMIVTVEGAKSHVKPAIVPDTVLPARVTALTVHYISGQAPLWGFNDDVLTLSCAPLHQPSNVVSGTADIHVMAQVMERFDQLTDKELKEAPAISVDCNDSMDFGSIKAGETVSRTFTVTNKGKSPLAIRRLWVPEGEGVIVNANRTEIKRGKSATFTVTVDSSQILGDLLNVPLTLLCNDPASPRLTIRLVGIIEN